MKIILVGVHDIIFLRFSNQRGMKRASGYILLWRDDTVISHFLLVWEPYACFFSWTKKIKFTVGARERYFSILYSRIMLCYSSVCM